MLGDVPEYMSGDGTYGTNGGTGLSWEQDGSHIMWEEKQEVWKMM